MGKGRKVWNGAPLGDLGQGSLRRLRPAPCRRSKIAEKASFLNFFTDFPICCHLLLLHTLRAGTMALSLGSLNHVSRVVSDVQASAAFYREVLGFTMVKRPRAFDFNGAWYAQLRSSCRFRAVDV